MAMGKIFSIPINVNILPIWVDEHTKMIHPIGFLKIDEKRLGRLLILSIRNISLEETFPQNIPKTEITGNQSTGCDAYMLDSYSKAPNRKSFDWIIFWTSNLDSVIILLKQAYPRNFIKIRTRRVFMTSQVIFAVITQKVT